MAVKKILYWHRNVHPVKSISMKKAILLLFVTSCLFVIKASAQTTPAPAIPEFSIADSASFTGNYKFENLPFENMTISVKEGKLGFTGGQYNGVLAPIKDKKDAFDVNRNASFTFLRDTANKVNELKLEYQGQSFLGKREAKKD